ncbi:glycogen-binding domain-containing protein [Desulforhopalus sp. 52FAK]
MKTIDHLISMYLDNELSLGQKCHFVNKVHQDKKFYESTVELIKQEKTLHNVLRQEAPVTKPGKIVQSRIVRLTGQAMVAATILTLSFFSGTYLQKSQQTASVNLVSDNYRRFVLHQKETDQVEIVGSFTQWKKIPLVRSGQEGYWEVTLKLPSGEHRYSFVINGNQHRPDPTVQDMEMDDFGSSNSILQI